ncbi:hypothetical protein EMMF5_002488 [Cystobasidiomycetes sp. EMM_F5]
MASGSISYKRLTTVEDFKTVLANIDHVLLDCDGVVWLEDHLIGHAKATIDLFRKHDVGVAFVSNNATSTRAAYREKFHKLGIDVPVDHIFTSGTASARYIKDVLLPTLPEGKQGIYLIGQHALELELQELGLKWTGGLDAEDAKLMPPQDFTTITPDPSIGVVLVNTGCILLLSNDDAQIPLHHGGTAAGQWSTLDFRSYCSLFGKGEGAIAAGLKLAAKGPVIVAGKPNQPLLDTVLAR